MIRLFVGIPLPEDIRKRLHNLSSGLQGARWISPENMHLTLRFIGEVDEVQAADIHDALLNIRSAAFEVSLSGIDAFGHGHMVRTIWAAVSETSNLNHLQAKIERAMVLCGLAAERRKFAPHVTLARVKKSPNNKAAMWLAGHEGLSTQPFPIEEFVLYRSHLGHQGAHYETLAGYPLLVTELS